MAGGVTTLAAGSADTPFIKTSTSTLISELNAIMDNGLDKLSSQENSTFLETKDVDDVGVHVIDKDGGRSTERQQWARKMDFLFACVGFSVGLGNVWRFPYLCYKNGGGAFLIPYIIFTIFGGIPLYYLEVASGQFMSRSIVKVWDICPLFQGVGFASMTFLFFMNINYNVILTWAFYYFFASFTSVLPWSTCDNEWNTCACIAIYGNDTNQTTALRPECYMMNTTNVSKHVDSVDEYWQRQVLDLSSGIDQPGTLKWDLTLCWLFAWIVVYFCVWKGIESSSKVMYFTAPAPYLFMFILLIRGLTLDGAVDGIMYYLAPDFEKLGSVSVWVDAGIQIMFSYAVGFGTQTALGSFNKFHHNSLRDCLIISGVNAGTSFLAGFIIFAILGFMANQQGVHIGEVATSGPGLAFIAYPKALAQLPLSPLWSALFFCMIILLGLDSQFVDVEAFVAVIADISPSFFQRKWYREIFTAIYCLVSAVIGLCMMTSGGIYVFYLLDYFFASRSVCVITLLECVAIAWVYGVNRFSENVEMMLGYRLKIPFFKMAWAFTTPVYIMFIIVASSVAYSSLTYNRTYVYPGWAVGIGWLLSIGSLLVIPLTMIVKLTLVSGSLLARLQKLIRPRLHHHQLRPNDDPLDLDKHLDEKHDNPENSPTNMESEM